MSSWTHPYGWEVKRYSRKMQNYEPGFVRKAAKAIYDSMDETLRRKETGAATADSNSRSQKNHCLPQRAVEPLTAAEATAQNQPDRMEVDGRDRRNMMSAHWSRQEADHAVPKAVTSNCLDILQ